MSETIASTPHGSIAHGPTDAAGWCLSGTYRKSPLAGTYALAELECVPMTRPHEYAQAALMEEPVLAPVLVSPSQRYRILAELLRDLRLRVPGLSCVLVRVFGPDFNVPLPADLLAADVLLVHDPLAALPAVLSSGAANVAVIDQDLRADGPERGHNQLTILLMNPQPAAAAQATLSAWLETSPLLRALDDARVAPLPRDEP